MEILRYLNSSTINDSLGSIREFRNHAGAGDARVGRPVEGGKRSSMDLKN